MKKVSMMMSIIIPIIFSITLFTTSADGSKQWTSYSNIAIDKEWSITFNQNIDSAFDRRFLFKIRFGQPNVQAKQAIWKSKLSWLTDIQPTLVLVWRSGHCQSTSPFGNVFPK